MILQKVVTTLERPTECRLSKGKGATIEYGAYEVRLLCQMLYKGSVDIMELVFSDNLEHASEAWKVCTIELLNI